MSAALVRALALALTLALMGAALPAAAHAASPPMLATAEWSLRVPAGSPAGFMAEAVDPDGDAVTLTWAFDDGTTATGPRVTKAWTSPGVHAARVTATDATGLTGTRDFTIEVTPAAGVAPLGPPPAGVHLPRPGPAPVARVTAEAVTLRLAAAGTVGVRLACAPTAVCTGTVSVARGGRRLGASGYTLPAGATATIAVRLPAATARALRRRAGRRVAVVLTLAPDGGAAKRAARTLVAR
jgi:hypothetical protein